MKYIITYHDKKNILQRYTQSEYNTISDAKAAIDYYITNKYEYAKFLNIMQADMYYEFKGC